MYQNYITGQTEFVLNYDFDLPANHIARLIDTFVDSIPSEVLLKDHVATTGRPLSHPAIMMKILLFAYSRQTYSGRKIELMLEENLPMRWLARDCHYSYHTINNFRSSQHMANLIKRAFVYFSMVLTDNGLISSDAIFIDGTKIEADANKYSFVWRRAVEKYHHKLRQKAVELYETLIEQRVVRAMKSEEAQSAAGMELIAADLDQEIGKLDEDIQHEPKIIKGGSPKKRRRRLLNKLLHRYKKDLIPRAKKYEEAEATFNGRNSYSKTDHDATFLCMKEDPMKNRELKPGYNLQIATNNQFVLDYALYPNPTDTRTLIPFLKQFHALKQFNNIVADAGYGSESNYTTLLDSLNKCPLIPYTTYEKETKRKYRNDPTQRHNWEYHEQDDYYIDHLGVRFNFYRYVQRTDRYGFQRNYKIYRADKFQLTPKLEQLAKTPGGRLRQIMVNPSWDYFKTQVKATLSSDEGKALYRRRKFDVEPVFGRMKRDFGVRRTHLRGQRSVENDLGILLMAMNLSKLRSLLVGRKANLTQNIKKRAIFWRHSLQIWLVLFLEDLEMILFSQPLFSKRLRFLKMFVILRAGIENTLKTIHINKERAYHNGKTSSYHLYGCQRSPGFDGDGFSCR